MNERIRLLAEQAKNFMTDQVLYHSRVHNRTLSVDEGADIFEEKFSELIVKECMELNRQELSFTAYARMAEIYSQHFGIEE